MKFLRIKQKVQTTKREKGKKWSTGQEPEDI